MGDIRNKPREPIPLTILTGFLGSGKTTLLNRILKSPAMADTAVIVNEFGEVGLDHLLMDQSEEGIIELSSGCLCCTIRGDLVNTLENLLRSLDNGRIERLKRVIIETTGLADPAPVLHTVMLHPYLVMRYRLDGVVTCVDAVNGNNTLDAHEEAVKQIAVADRLVITKTDLIDRSEVEPELDLKARLKALNPGATMLDNAAGEASFEALFNCGLYDPASKTPDVARWLKEEQYASEHAGHDHAHDHAHDVNRHDDNIRAFSLTTDKLISVQALEMFLDLLRSAHGPKLLRMKGIVGIQSDPDHPVVVHGVQHVFHPPVVLDKWPSEDRRTRLVFITRDLPEEFVRKMFTAFTGGTEIDTPDTAAMTDNPLAITGFSGKF
ncbi:MAG: GTP-binding protein [Stappiaceae bacterium]